MQSSRAEIDFQWFCRSSRTRKKNDGTGVNLRNSWAGARPRPPIPLDYACTDSVECEKTSSSERKSAAPATDPTATGARVINYYHDPGCSTARGCFGSVRARARACEEPKHYRRDCRKNVSKLITPGPWSRRVCVFSSFRLFLSVSFCFSLFVRRRHGSEEKKTKQNRTPPRDGRRRRRRRVWYVYYY